MAQVAATGPTDTEALRLARTAVDVYTERRRDAFRASVEGSLASVDRTLRDIAPPPGEDAPPDARVDRLEALRTDLLLLANRDDSGVQVLEPPVVDRPGLPSWVLGTVLGAALGGLVALGALELHRSRRRTLVGAAQAAAITDRVLHPEVRLPADWRTRTLQVLRANDRETARLLVAQIARRRPMGGHVVAVAGASAGSASRAVATMIAVGLARQTPTVLAEINAAGSPHPLVPADPLGVPPPAGRRIPTQMDGLEMFRLDRPPPTAEDEAWTVLLDLARSGGRCVVIDAGPASEVLRLLPATSEPVLVLGAGVDDVARATALAAAVRIGTAPLLGVVTRQAWQARLRRRTPAAVDG
ncbi:hypothetical protein BJF78_17455 [Pseudonocardia sp. CNS-139]|nr:hypothetical protein BJF78_17455 [Pseudonocardia sp. CNS-139]